MNKELILTSALTLALVTASAHAACPPTMPGIGPALDVWYDCWDCPYQCRGDADCQPEGGFRKYPVGMTDLNIFLAYWKAKYPPYDPCLDFNHDGKIDFQDQAILERYLLKPMSELSECPTRPLRLNEMTRQILPAGSTYTITWTDIPASCSRSYILHYSTDNGENWRAIDFVGHACSYDWLIPPVDSDQCLLRIRDTYSPFFPDYFQVVIQDTTDEPFTIYQPCDSNNPLTLQTPDPGEFLLAGSTCTITWSDCRPPDPCTGSYMLYYSTDAGQNWLPVDTNSVDGACSHDWLVPSTPSDQCLLRIEDAADPDVNDLTDAPFCIYECQQTIPGDLDGNCYVDFRDFGILTQDWPTNPDFQPILELANRWCCCQNLYDPTCAP